MIAITTVANRSTHALSTGAVLELVNGAAAQRLDAAGGVAAALRYPSVITMTDEFVPGSGLVTTGS